MKHYPTIAHFKNQSGEVYAFDKLDGSNIRVEWSQKKEFYKFGSRKVLIDESHEFLGESIKLIKAKEEQFTEIFKKQKWQRVISFFEFCGNHSCFGQHVNDEPHSVTLIDVAPYKQGLLPPQDFIKLFKECGIPKVLYQGNLNSDIVDAVKKSTLEGMTFEGVVCKGAERKTKFSKPLMFKIKSDAWMGQLKEYCRGNIGLFDKLR